MTPRQRRVLRKAIKLVRAGQTQYAVDRHVNEWTAPARALVVTPRVLHVAMGRARRAMEFWKVTQAVRHAWEAGRHLNTRYGP